MKRIQDYDYGIWQYKAAFGRQIKDITRVMVDQHTWSNLFIHDPDIARRKISCWAWNTAAEYP